MSELHAAQQIVPEIGDVLASIRKLISHDDAKPDFSRPMGRMDSAGQPRVTLPLGPGAERIRSVIERELNTLTDSETRLVLATEARVGEHSMLRQNGAVADPQPSEPHRSEQIDTPEVAGLSEQAVLGRPAGANGIAFDEARYLETIANRDRSDVAAHVASFADHQGPLRGNILKKDDNMMLAEISRADQNVTSPAESETAFDLFAAEAAEDDDQLSGGNALRSLVRDVVRQELQGEMGERISRNLRRAIRNEVAAAIAAGLKIA